MNSAVLGRTQSSAEIEWCCSTIVTEANAAPLLYQTGQFPPLPYQPDPYQMGQFQGSCPFIATRQRLENG